MLEFLKSLFIKITEPEEVFLHRDSGGVYDLTNTEECAIVNKEGDKDE